jgi:hypothetical protein
MVRLGTYYISVENQSVKNSVMQIPMPFSSASLTSCSKTSSSNDIILTASYELYRISSFTVRQLPILCCHSSPELIEPYNHNVTPILFNSLSDMICCQKVALHALRKVHKLAAVFHRISEQ